MKQVAKFEKVTLEQFINDWQNQWDDEIVTIKEIHDYIKLPRRATSGSAGYDFFLPMDIVVNPNESILIPTGIRVRIDRGWVLKLYPRSSLGFKYRIQLNNTVGIIDSDYFYAENEGHIMIKITNDTNEELVCELDEGKAFAQGVFVEYGITYDDDAIDQRIGGFGSTDIS